MTGREAKPNAAGARGGTTGHHLRPHSRPHETIRVTPPTIRYLNTDLDLVAADDLTALAEGLGALGLYALHVGRREDGLWYATFETDDGRGEPEHDVVLMLAAVEALDESRLGAWRACVVREFNVGYEGGDGPRGFNHLISPTTLRRMADAGAGLYPPAPSGEAT